MHSLLPTAIETLITWRALHMLQKAFTNNDNQLWLLAKEHFTS